MLLVLGANILLKKEYIPTLVVIENGKETKRSVGAISKDELLELIK